MRDPQVPVRPALVTDAEHGLDIERANGERFAGDPANRRVVVLLFTSRSPRNASAGKSLC